MASRWMKEDETQAVEPLGAQREAELIGSGGGTGAPDTSTTMSMRRINVNFAPSAYAALDRLARRNGKTMSEVLRDAIQLESWLADATDEGWHILLERNGHVRELVRP